MKTALAKWATASTKSLNSLVGGSGGSESHGGGVVRSEAPAASPRGRTDSEVALVGDMDPRFYQADFDCVGAILGQLAADCSDRNLENCLQTYDNLLCVVKGQLSSQIFANYNEFVSIMEGIHDIETDLNAAVDLTIGTRAVLAGAQNNLVRHTFDTIWLHRIRSRLVTIRAALGAAHSLARADADIDQAMEAGQYDRALRVLGDCVRLRPHVGAITAASALTTNVANGYERLEAHLLSSLTKAHLGTPAKRQLPLLFPIVDAFVALETQRGFSDRLLEALAKSLDGALFQVVKESCAGAKDVDDPPGAESFGSLCALMTSTEFADCYKAALNVAVTSLFFAFKTRQYLETKFADVAARSETQSLILNAIQHGRVSIWERVQQRLLQLLRSTRANAVENNLQEVESIYSRSSALMAIGELFSGIGADLLQPVVSEKCLQYFSSLHIQTCERLVLALDSDSWQKLPLPDSFDFHDIKELKSEYSLAIDTTRRSVAAPPPGSLLFTTFADGADPFAVVPSPILSPLSHPVSVAAPPPPTPSSPFIIASSGLFVLQSVGKYLGLMRTLPILRQAAWKAIQDLFDIYLIAVMSLFLAEYPRFVEGHPSFAATSRRYPRMCAVVNAALGTMRDRRFAYGGVRIIGTTTSGGPRFLKPAQISLDQAEDLYALAVRHIALQSLKRIAAVFTYLKPALERYVTPTEEVGEAASRMPSLVSDLQEAQYWFLASRLMTEQVRPLVQQIGSCKWDVAELSEAANAYVDKIVSVLRSIKNRLDALHRSDDISDAVVQSLSGNAMRIIMDSLVDAFSAIKRCSTEGRAAMSLDVSVLQRSLRDVFGTWPVPGSARVDDYIRAYYLPSQDLLEWVAAHRQEFTLEHHLGLARVSSAVATMKPKEVTEFLDQVTKRYNESTPR